MMSKFEISLPNALSCLQLEGLWDKRQEARGTCSSYDIYSGVINTSSSGKISVAFSRAMHMQKLWASVPCGVLVW